MTHAWESRGPNRPPDAVWDSTLRRVRAEFEEMPGLRVTMEQARALFGLSDAVLDKVMDRLAIDGFLEWRNGQYLRRKTEP